MIENNKNILEQELIVINIGLPQFAENLRKQNIEVVHVDWRPPEVGDKEITDLLDELL
jgi:hypothetical protein